jgi:hypothetical protein
VASPPQPARRSSPDRGTRVGTINLCPPYELLLEDWRSVLGDDLAQGLFEHVDRLATGNQVTFVDDHGRH